jgi:hypothetical protein
VAWLLTDAALELPGVTHVEIHHDKANQASAGIPRKLGFRWMGESGDEPEAPADIGIEWRWRMDRAAWAARPSPTDPGWGYGRGWEPLCTIVTVPELSGWVLPGA